MNTSYEMVIGLEVHIELKTKTKIFCACPTAFGAAPNTHVCPICLGYPGTLPKLNEEVVRYAIKAGLAANCTIAAYSKQDRKNYFYPDLPKAYQISQYDLPLCSDGFLEIETHAGPKKIRITRIHIEEDAGKLVHTDKGTLFDANRCGVPLIEIVSEPDIRSAEEAVAYVKKLRALMLYAGVSDCKMNEGSLRCDVNLSVRKRGEETLGTRTEMKNINSFAFIAKAIEYEFDRQVEELEAGNKIVQETRRFDASSGKTFSMRSKEDADDYRYFPDPDLAPIVISKARIQALADEIPTLPDARKAKYMSEYALTAYDAEQICASPDTAAYFERAANASRYPKTVANMMISEVLRYSEDGAVALTPKALAKIADMAGDGVINSGTAKKLIAECSAKDDDPEEIVKARGLAQISDAKTLTALLKEAMDANPKAVADFRAGKTAAAKSIVGAVMAKSGGRANPALCGQLLDELLK